MFDQVLAMAMAVIGGLGIFMLGMKYLSEGIQAVAGNSLRKMISMVTNNRLLAVGTGTGVTMLIQSSSVTTVIVVGLVNAGLMQLHQSVGVIIGANIGTTITGWILTLKVDEWGLPLLGISALFFVFIKRDRIRFISMAAMGLGMIFFGLELMKNGMSPMRDMPQFVQAFSWFHADSYLGIFKCIMIGCMLTLVVQSSSATLGITISLASQGVIPFDAAAALVLGENIGTTITVVLASIGGTTNAKRTAYAHVLFNVIGVTYIAILFPWYVKVVSGVIEQMPAGLNPLYVSLEQHPDNFGQVVTAGIALVHSGFNIINALLFLPFIGPFVRLLEKLAPEPAVAEVAHLRHLDARAVDAPVLGVEQSRGEVVQMGLGVLKMSQWIRDLTADNVADQKLIEKVFRREEVLDNIEQEIVAFLTQVLDGNVPRSVAQEGREQLRIAHEYESTSDRLASVLKAHLKLKDKKLQLPDEQKKDLLDLHDRVTRFIKSVAEAYEKRQAIDNAQAHATSSAIIQQVKKLREDHLQRMIESSVNPNLSLIYTALLTDYRRINAHTLNVHEAVVGEKVSESDQDV